MLRIRGFSDRRGRFTVGTKPSGAGGRTKSVLQSRRVLPAILSLLTATLLYPAYLYHSLRDDEGTAMSKFASAEAAAAANGVDDDDALPFSRGRNSLFWGGWRGGGDGLPVWNRPTLLSIRQYVASALDRAGNGGADGKGGTSLSSNMTGSFAFEDSVACSRRRRRRGKMISRRGSGRETCQIHFPKVVEVGMGGPGQQPNAASASSNFCLVTMKGDKGAVRSPNQDRALLLSPVLFDDDGYNRESGVVRSGGGAFGWLGGGDDRPAEGGAMGRTNWIASLFDGHGPHGHYSAEVSLFDLPFRVLQNMPPASKQREDTAAYYRTVTDFLMESFARTDDPEGMVRGIPNSGTTGMVAMRRGRHVHAATVGDSTLFLAAWNGTKATVLREAVRHKPGDAAERARIERAGGRVLIPPHREEQQGASSRVVLTSEDGITALAMSRSLGDPDGKRAGFLSAEPAVFHFDVRAHFDEPKGRESSNLAQKYDRLFLVVASDGVADMVKVPTLASLLGRALFSVGGDSRTAAAADHLQQACESVIQDAARKWAQLGQVQGMPYRDDITLVVTKI